VVALVRPLAEAAQAEREARVEPFEDEAPEVAEAALPVPAAEPEPVTEPVLPETPAETTAEATPAPAPAMVVDAERVRAAVTVALDRAMPAMIDEITERVLVALGQ